MKFEFHSGVSDKLDHACRLLRKAQAAGVKVKLVNYEEMIHGFFTMAGFIEAAKPAIADAAKAVKAGLGG